ncbi:hypothetical protein TNCV_597261 [Trichonephila clavipes]|nr:hypothetical protein TNCV_597261 [Trichonephila clavipes]
MPLTSVRSGVLVTDHCRSQVREAKISAMPLPPPELEPTISRVEATVPGVVRARLEEGRRHRRTTRSSTVEYSSIICRSKIYSFPEQRLKFFDDILRTKLSVQWSTVLRIPDVLKDSRRQTHTPDSSGRPTGVAMRPRPAIRARLKKAILTLLFFKEQIRSFSENWDFERH